MNPQLYKTIWPEEDSDEIEWITPRSVEEVQDLEKLFADLDSLRGGESGSAD